MSRWVESVERRIAAPADQLYALVADPTRHTDIGGSSRRFAWQSRPHRNSAKWRRYMFGGRIWRYEFEPHGDATLVRERRDMSEEPLRVVFFRFRATARESMRRTLERTAVLVEST